VLTFLELNVKCISIYDDLSKKGGSTMSKYIKIFCVLLIVTIAPASYINARSGRIVMLLSENDYSTCCAVNTYTEVDLNIYYLPGDEPYPIKEAEFKVDKIGTAVCLGSEFPPNIALSIGDYFSGIALVLDSCPEISEIVPLGKIKFITIDSSTTCLTIRKNPNNTVVESPSVAWCDEGNSFHEVLGSTFTINPSECNLALDHTWYVRPDSTGEVLNIQDAIDLADVGDTVQLSEGTFIGLRNRGLDLKGKDIVVRGTVVDDSLLSMIDCNSEDRAFYLHSGESNDAFIEYLIIKNADGNASDTPHSFGGAFYCNNSSPTIRYNEIYQCVAHNGNAVYCDSSSAKIIGNNIHSNGSYLEGGAQAICVKSGYYEIKNNKVYNNKGGYPMEGAGIACYSCSVIISGNEIYGNSLTPQSTSKGAGIYCENVQNSFIKENIINGNEACYGGAIYSIGADNLVIEDNEIYSNRAFLFGPGLTSSIDYEFGLGGAIYCDSGIIRGNIIHSNSGFFGGGIYALDATIDNNIIINNAAGYDVSHNNGAKGGGIYLAGNATVTNNTIYGNRTGDYGGGGGIYINSSGHCSISNCIIAANSCKSSGSGGGIYCESPPEYVELSCSDVFDNTYENYAGTISDQTGINGNISEDPKFCDLESFTLWSDSPCSEANSKCGLIGAKGISCVRNYPFITRIEDVGNDQGRHVSIQWYRSYFDTLSSSNQILSYEVYRRIDDLPHLSDLSINNTTDHLDENRIVCDPLMYPPGEWYYLFSVPAHCEDIYNVIAPTLEDSCVYNDSTYYSVFFIRAATSNPGVYYDSPVDSGYSMDNLAPAMPNNFKGEQFAYDLKLSWDPNTEEDFSHYVIYRGDSISFNPDKDNMIAVTTDTFATDKEWNPSYNNYYYKLAAFDINWNMSKCSLLIPEGVIATLLQSMSISLNDYKVVLRWVLSEMDDGVNFSVFRSEKDGNFIKLSNSNIKRNNLTFQFIDETCEPGGTYKYIVKTDEHILFETKCITIPSMKLTLFQNYPNPFNPNTSIKYYLPNQDYVSLRIFNASGELVKILLSKDQLKGYHTIIWDGKDRHGNNVTSGVYFYTLKAGKQTITKKMVLLR